MFAPTIASEPYRPDLGVNAWDAAVLWPGAGLMAPFPISTAPETRSGCGPLFRTLRKAEGPLISLFDIAIARGRAA